MIDKILGKKSSTKKASTQSKKAAPRKTATATAGGKKKPVKAKKAQPSAKKTTATARPRKPAAKKTTTRKKAVPRKTVAKKAAAKRKPASSKTATKTIKPSTENPVSKSRLSGGLLGMKSFFKKMHKNQVHHEHAQEQIIADFSARIEKTFNHFHADFDERERLLEKKLKYAEKDQEREIRRVKWMSVPTGLLAIAGLVYIFYVVHIMERSMTSMSADMQQISGHILAMSEDTRSMTGNIATMSNSMGRIDYRMANMDRNMGQMSHSMVPIGKAANRAEPMMNMMNTFMPF